MAATDTGTQQQSHPLDELLQALQKVVDRIPWSSDVQHLEVLAHLRQAEEDLKGDAIDQTSGPVIRPAPVLPPAAETAAIAAGAGVPVLDYDKLADAMVRAQTRQAAIADQQNAQAAEAVAANPGWTPPGSVTAPPVESVAAQAAATDPNAQPA